MKNKLKKYFTAKVWLSIFVFICFAFIGITYFTDILTKPLQKISSAIVIPMQKGVNGIGLWLTEKKDIFASVTELQEKNAQLEKQIEELRQENLLMKENKVELETLRKLYEIDNIYSDYEMTGATVIGRSSDNWYNTFTIDKGKNDGIEVDMNVLSGNGLVGIITSVSDNYSIVRAIIDDASNVSAMLLNTSDICTLSGDLKTAKDGYVTLKYLDRDVKIRDGDMIVTSNISQKYLPGILIGYAKDVTVDENNLTQSGKVITAVDFKHFTNVLIIKQKKITSK